MQQGAGAAVDKREYIQQRIIEDLAEGVLTIDFDGIVEGANRAALEILGREERDLVGRSFAQVFLEDEENDGFVQCVLDAVYEKGRGQEGYASFRTPDGVRQLRIVSSYLRDGETPVAVILVISDITELTEMRDAVRAMEKIRRLNRQLELRNRVLQETFGRYMSDDVAREILDSPMGWRLGGQKQRLTILMSDLRGFTALSERMEPQDLITMLNHYFSEMYTQISRYGGTLIEFMGDGMLVIFGAPVRSETHAADAVACALGMQRRLRAVNRWNAERGYEPLSMGVGINTGDVILGNIGSMRRTKYGVLGAAVNLAGRIESFTTGGQVLIAPATREAIDCPLQIRQSISVTPKGVQEEIVLSDVVGIGAPYMLKLESGKDRAQPLPRPAEIRFGLLAEKQIERDDLPGSLLALSGTETVMRTREKLSLYDDLCLGVAGGLYAKVTDLSEEYCLLTFTGKTPDFDAWAESLLPAPDGERAEENTEQGKREA